ncbi:MAG: glycosyltransferase [Alphaproteobacteria bacterium]|nr:glycosyltransferase [Alphaproteobacteria bacterium]
MAGFISIISPNYNGEATIGTCLAAAFASRHANFEVIVVDDGSTDNSVAAIREYPCLLIRLDRQGGTSRARNIGALHARGDILFFTDADCILDLATLSTAAAAAAAHGPDVVIGGTYARTAYEDTFLGNFQAGFINHYETRNADNPDYIAGHAMIMDAGTFRDSGGFTENFLAVIEDVEFSHRLRRAGCRLVMNPDIEVRHIFNFSLRRSLANAVRKALFWTHYSLANGGALGDSGTASVELKVNVLATALCLVLALSFLVTGNAILPLAVCCVMALNLTVSRGLFMAFHARRGFRFTAAAAAYYVSLYPVAVGLGAACGMLRFLWFRCLGRQLRGDAGAGWKLAPGRRVP